MRKKTKISLTNRKIIFADTGFSERIAGKYGFRTITSGRSFSPLKLFYLSFSSGKSFQTAKMIWIVNTYLYFFISNIQWFAGNSTKDNFFVRRDERFARIGTVRNDKGVCNKIVDNFSNYRNFHMPLFCHSCLSGIIFEFIPTYQKSVLKKGFWTSQNDRQIRQIDILPTNLLHTHDKALTFFQDEYLRLVPAQIVTSRTSLIRFTERFNSDSLLVHKTQELIINHSSQYFNTKENKNLPISHFEKVGLKGDLQVNHFAMRDIFSKKVDDRYSNRKLDFINTEFPIKASGNYKPLTIPLIDYRDVGKKGQTSVAADTNHTSRLDYFHPDGSGGKGNRQSSRIQNNAEVIFTKDVSGARIKSASKQDINVNQIANEVYKLIENRIKIEKERRGLFR